MQQPTEKPLKVAFICHYTDDFITAGPPGIEECQHNLATMLEACNQLGIPSVDQKCVGAPHS